MSGQVEEEEDVGGSKSVCLSAGALVLEGIFMVLFLYQQQQISWSEPVSGQINDSASPPSPGRPGGRR